MRNIISFLNMKGGVAKTTLCKEISYYLAEKMNKRILIIDIDPQSNCTQSFFEKYKINISNNKELPSIQNIFKRKEIIDNENGTKDIIKEFSENLHLIPGELETVFMERETSSGINEQKLLNFIEDNDLKNKYDYIFIDCPPTYSFYTICSLLTSDFYFIPVKLDTYSILGLDLLERVVKEVKDNNRYLFMHKPLENLGVIFTMTKSNDRRQRNYADALKENQKFKDIYIFENEFSYYSKINTLNMENFIIDRKDTNLQQSLEKIVEELVERVKEKND